MSTSTDPAPALDVAWVALASAPAEECQAAMVARFRELLGTTVEERAARLDAMFGAEQTLSDKELRSFTASRLRARIVVASEDSANELQVAVDAAERRLSGSASMRRTVALQGACRDLTLDEVAKVESFFPSIRQLVGLQASPRAAATTPGASAEVAAPPRRRSFLKFFSRA